MSSGEFDPPAAIIAGMFLSVSLTERLRDLRFLDAERKMDPVEMGLAFAACGGDLHRAGAGAGDDILGGPGRGRGGRGASLWAAYLAESVGLKAWGLNAREVTGAGAVKTDHREKLARVKMWLDVKVLGTEPKFLGEKVKLPL